MPLRLKRLTRPDHRCLGESLQFDCRRSLRMCLKRNRPLTIYYELLNLYEAITLSD